MDYDPEQWQQMMDSWNRAYSGQVANPYQQALGKVFGENSPFFTGYTNIGGIGYAGMGYATPPQLRAFAADPGNIYGPAGRTATPPAPIITQPTTATGTTPDANIPAEWRRPVTPLPSSGQDDIFARGGSAGNLGGLLGKNSPYSNPFK